MAIIFYSLDNLGQGASQDLIDRLSTPSQPFTLGVKNSTTYTVTVSQLIFSGEYIVGLQAAKAYLQISKLSYEKEERDLKANVLINYASILILEDNLKTITSSVENLENLVRQTNALR